MSESEQLEHVSVSRQALDALIEYADSARQQRDSEFCVGIAEHNHSQQQFDALIEALGLT